MLLTWTPQAWEDYLYWQVTDKRTVKRINELLRDAAQYQVFIYGCILLVIIIGLPGGLVGASKDIKRWIQRRLQKKAVSAEGGKSDVA